MPESNPRGKILEVVALVGGLPCLVLLLTEHETLSLCLVCGIFVGLRYCNPPKTTLTAKRDGKRLSRHPEIYYKQPIEQLKYEYLLISFIFFFSCFGQRSPLDFVRRVTDPVGQPLAIIGLLLLVPGVVIVLIRALLTLWLLTICLSVLMLCLFAMKWLWSLSPIGKGVVSGLYFPAAFFIYKYFPESPVEEYLGRIVDKVGFSLSLIWFLPIWMLVLLPKHVISGFQKLWQATISGTRTMEVVHEATKEETTAMDEVYNKREQYEEAVSKLKSDPDIKDIVPIVSANSDDWLMSVIDRLRDRGRQKNYEEKIKLAEKARRLYAESRSALDEYRGLLEAHDDLIRVQRGHTSKEKDEEEVIRSLERKKRRLMVEREISELSKPPQDAPPPSDRRSAEDKKLAALSRADQAEREKIKECHGDHDCEERVKRIYEDLRMRIMEER